MDGAKPAAAADAPAAAVEAAAAAAVPDAAVPDTPASASEPAVTVAADTEPGQIPSEHDAGHAATDKPAADGKIGKDQKTGGQSRSKSRDKEAKSSKSARDKDKERDGKKADKRSSSKKSSRDKDRDKDRSKDRSRKRSRDKGEKGEGRRRRRSGSRSRSPSAGRRRRRSLSPPFSGPRGFDRRIMGGFGGPPRGFGMGGPGFGPPGWGPGPGWGGRGPGGPMPGPFGGGPWDGPMGRPASPSFGGGRGSYGTGGPPLTFEERQRMVASRASPPRERLTSPLPEARAAWGISAGFERPSAAHSSGGGSDRGSSPVRLMMRPSSAGGEEGAERPSSRSGARVAAAATPAAAEAGSKAWGAHAGWDAPIESAAPAQAAGGAANVWQAPLHQQNGWGGARASAPSTAGCAPSAGAADAVAAAQPAAAAATQPGQPVPGVDLQQKIWYYLDPQGQVQGPCSIAQFHMWLKTLGADPKLRTEFEQFRDVSVWKENMQVRVPLQTLVGAETLQQTLA